MLLDRSAIKLESCAVAGANFDVTIMGYAGHTYQLQTSSALNPPSWANLGPPQAGAGQILEFTHTNGVVLGRGFYRVAFY